MKPSFCFLILSTVLFVSCDTTKKLPVRETYVPDDPALYKKIISLDSEYFNAYNHCDMELQSKFYSDSVEFYHDKGGLMTSKADLLEAIRKNICGKVTRELVQGSIEVYPIHNFGAIEIGMHRFHNNQEPPPAIAKASKFIIFWHETKDGWQIHRVVSLH